MEINKEVIDENISPRVYSFKDDFADALSLEAGQYHEEENYLDIDLSGETGPD